MCPLRSADVEFTPRRPFLPASGTALLSTATVYSEIGAFVAEALLEDINIFNETDQEICGAIEIIGPAGDTVLEQTVELVCSEVSAVDDDEKNTAATFADVWTDAGVYEVSIELMNTDIVGTTRVNEMVRIQHS